MIVTSIDATTTPTSWFRAPASGEGTLGVSATVIADGVKLQGSNDRTNAYDLTDVTVTTNGGSVNFKTDFRYIRVAPITGAVTAERVELSGLEL
jgi:hypothetical protein